MKRLLVCQGSMQYVAAAAAVETCSTQPGPGEGDTLLLHDLSLSPTQGQAWSQSLAAMAHQLDGIRQVAYLDPQQVEAITALPSDAAVAQLTRQLGGPFDEVYLQQNDNAVNRLAAATSPAARRICFGDGIGVNYSPGYWYPRRYRWQNRRAAAAHRRGLDRWPAVGRFHRYCLLLPNLFDHRVWWRLTRPSTDCFTRRFARLAPTTSFTPPWHADTPTVVLLTSCFSEAGRMQADRECEAYERVVRAGGDTSAAALVIKPHPRDRPDKLHRLAERLRPHFREMAVLDDEQTMFLPFEALFVRHWLGMGDRVRVVCFSSACLSLEHLYGHRCETGFGESLVRETFDPIYINARVQQERELDRAVRIVRTRRSSFCGAHKSA